MRSCVANDLFDGGTRAIALALGRAGTNLNTIFLYHMDTMVAQRTASTIDEYLRSVPEDRRMTLEDLRRKIRAVIPDAQEVISYRIPAFRLNGVVVAGFCATAKGCSYFPFSGTTLKSLARDLGAYEQTKSSLHFAADKGLPAALVRKLIKARIKETRE